MLQLAACSLAIVLLCSLDATARPRSEVPTEAKQRAMAFWSALSSARLDALKSFYARKVTLRAGSELLKRAHGLTEQGRRKDLAVSRDRLIAAYKKLIDRVGKEKWKKVLARVKEDKITYLLATKRVRPMSTREGDVLVKVVTGPGDDAMFYIWRKGADGKWWLTEEQTDW